VYPEIAHPEKLARCFPEIFAEIFQAFGKMLNAAGSRTLSLRAAVKTDAGAAAAAHADGRKVWFARQDRPESEDDDG
jgi:hypothetical protein